jgi:adenylate cyclase
MTILLNATPHRFPRRLTRLYICSLSAIAVMSLGGQVLVQRQLARQNDDMQMVSLARNRQRLCENLLKTTLAAKLDLADRPTHLAQLQQLIDEWDGTKEVLRKQLGSTMSSRQMQEVEPMFAKLAPLSGQILTTAREVLTTTPQAPGRLRGDGRSLPGGAALAVPQLIKTGTEFNQTIDQLITWYSGKVEAGLAQLKLLEMGLFGLTLGVLLLEGLLVFRPAVQQLQNSLEALARSLMQLTQEQEKSEKLLLNILPEPIAERLKTNPKTIADSFAEATVLFADIVGFTELSGRVSPEELVQRLNEIFSRFDLLAERHGLEKIKTIGDAYMVVGGLPTARADHAEAIAQMALDMQTELQQINTRLGESFNIRIGINSGPVVAGVIGIKKFIYDLWGDTVNVASRMESHGQPGQVHVSESAYKLLQYAYTLEPRGTIAIKGKGEMTTYWLKGPKLGQTAGAIAS